MKRLIVLRHAKSSWKSDAASDHDRPLSGRGKRSAPLVGAALLARGWVPDVVLCSDARRARDTYQRMASCFPDADVRLCPELYAAGLEEVSSLCSQLPAGITTAMVVGHNPGWEVMVRALTGEGVLMTTGNAALLESDAASFAEAFGGSDGERDGAARFRLIELIRPRDPKH